MAYQFGAKSRENLQGVRPVLVGVMERAIQITTQDFSIHEGVRTAERQTLLFNQGRSKIDGINERGRHQQSEDGFGNAVDAVPYCDGELVWEWDLIFPVCDAVRQAAKELHVVIRWGGIWREITRPKYDGMTAKEIYLTRPRWDGAHYELPSRLYP